MNSADWRKWLALGTGVGIEAGAEDLRVTMARVRPSGVRVVGSTVIPRFRERPVAEWGAEYAAFLKQCGGGHLAATVLLPRREIIVRQLALPGVADKDLASAISFELDSLHPYAADDAVYGWARVGATSTVVVAIARRSLINRYAEMFAEAGIKVSGFTCSAVAVYTALRLYGAPPPEGFVSATPAGDGRVEIYGEGPAQPVYSATVEAPAEDAAALAAAQLRLTAGAAVTDLSQLLPAPRRAPEGYDLSREALHYATALAGACLRPALSLNLLPAEFRTSSSRAIFVPTVTLAALLLLVFGALAVNAGLEERRYLATLEAEIARVEPQAKRAMALDRSAEEIRARVRLLDGFRRRSRADLDALNELTRILPPPTWLNMLELTRNAVTLSGETEQAAGLLKVIDSSPHFRDSEFSLPLSRAANIEVFRIRAEREGEGR